MEVLRHVAWLVRSAAGDPGTREPSLAFDRADGHRPRRQGGDRVVTVRPSGVRMREPKGRGGLPEDVSVTSAHHGDATTGYRAAGPGVRPAARPVRGVAVGSTTRTHRRTPPARRPAGSRKDPGRDASW
jgi:hypothetical protein